MKYLFSFFLALCCTLTFSAGAEEMFNSENSFKLAKAVKLGRGKSYSVNAFAGLASGEIAKGCASPCSLCDEASGNCLECPAGYSLSAGTCHAAKSCGDACADCDGTTGNCRTCNSGYYLENGICLAGCQDGYVMLDAECRKLGCPSGYSDFYEYLQNGAVCTLSPGREVFSTGASSYGQCANCIIKSCPTATYRADQIQNCKTNKSTGYYSGPIPCVECTLCNSGYYLFMNECHECINAVCDGTGVASCQSGYANGGLTTEGYVCTKTSSCSCTASSTGTYSGSLESDYKVSFPTLCTRTPDGSCPYQTLGTYIQLNSSKTSVTGTGDTRISCSMYSSGKIKCTHTWDSGKSFYITY